jgi:hypothetical protein
MQAHFLPLALLSALLLGVTVPQLGLAAANLQIPTFTTFGIFIIQVGGSQGRGEVAGRGRGRGRARGRARGRGRGGLRQLQC